MDRSERRHFINELTENITARAICNSDSLPDDWDGMELREYIADLARQACVRKMPRARRLAYNNTTIVSDLL